jgi:hypothetical protein
MAFTVKSRRAASSSCGPQTLSRSTRPLASTACFMLASSPLLVRSLPDTCSAAVLSM